MDYHQRLKRPPNISRECRPNHHENETEESLSGPAIHWAAKANEFLLILTHGLRTSWDGKSASQHTTMEFPTTLSIQLQHNHPKLVVRSRQPRTKAKSISKTQQDRPLFAKYIDDVPITSALDKCTVVERINLAINYVRWLPCWLRNHLGNPISNVCWRIGDDEMWMTDCVMMAPPFVYCLAPLEGFTTPPLDAEGQAVHGGGELSPCPSDNDNDNDNDNDMFAGG